MGYVVRTDCVGNIYSARNSVPLPICSTSLKLFPSVNHIVTVFFAANRTKHLFVHLFFLLLHPASEEAIGVTEIEKGALKKGI